MNNVTKRSLMAILLSVFVLGLGFSSVSIIPSVPAISVAHAGGCTIGAIGTAITNNVSDLIPSVGETITYTLSGTMSNITDPTTVTVNDALSAGLTFVSSTANVGTYSSSTGVWNLGTISSSTSMPVTLQISATVNTGTEGEIIDSNPTIDYSQSVGTSCAQSAAINAISMTVQGTPVPPSADLAVTKNVDVTTTTPGNTVHYTVKITDKGPATSTGATATDVLPAGLIFQNATASVGSYAPSTGIWTIGDLAPSSTATLVYAATVDPSIIATTTIVNSVSISESASTTDPVVSNNTASVGFLVVPNATTTPTSTPSADVAITKIANVTSTVPGGEIDYTITASNLSSSTTSTGVFVTDTLPVGLTLKNATASVGSYASSTGTWTIGDMSPSSTATLDIAAFVNATGTAGRTITNTATIDESASTTDPNLSNNSSSVSVIVQGGGGSINADIAITKTANVTSTLPGGTIDYTIVATALGPNPSTDVVATDTLPSGLTFVSATTSEGSYASSTGTWTIGTLNANATTTLQIVALVNASGTAGTTITNIATIGESPMLTDTNTANNTARSSVVIGSLVPATDSDIAIMKTVDNANPLAGATVHFTVVVTDDGPATSTFVVAHDQLPMGLSFVSATTSQGLYNMSTGDWNIGTLGPNATATLLMAAEVDSNATGGTTFTNTATVTSTLTSLIDPNLTNNSSSVTLTVKPSGCTSNCGGGGGGGGSVQANIAITKTVDNASPATGAVIHYTLTVKDFGPSDSSGVIASDILPSGLTFDSATSSEGSYNSSTGIWTIGVIPNGQSATLVIAATVTAAGGKTITNVGTVSESPGIINTTPQKDTSSATITVAGGGDGGGQVLGASTSTGQVLGASCGLYLTSYIHPYRQNLNDPVQVKKLQTFLNMNLGLKLPITGYYGPETIAAVNQFQVKYHNEVLSPWVPLGLPTPFTPTGYVYQTTQRWINLIMCPALNLPLPALKVDNGE